MKLVTAVIKPHKWEDVREALETFGVTGMTVSDVKGFGQQKGHTEIYRGSEYTVDFQPKVKLEIAVADELVANVLQTLRSAASTGKIGDGKIFVHTISEALRIRTGESGQDAL